MKRRFLIVDDEPLARRLLISHLSKIEGLEMAGECSNAIEAMSLLQREPVDLMFLDIQMPEITGIDFIKTLTRRPAVILTTAHRDFALEAFDLDVVDYLLKPISFERLLKAVNKFYDKERASPTPEQALQPDYFYVKADRKMHKISMDDVCYIESLDDYVRVILKDKTIITRENISSLEEKLPDSRFVRTHRSYLVSLAQVTSFSSEGLEVNGKTLPFGRVYKSQALSKLASASNY